MLEIPMHMVGPASKIITDMDTKFPLPVAIALGRIQKALDEWSVPLQERIQAMVSDHLEEGETELSPDHKNWGAFQEAYSGLVSEKAEVTCNPISVDDLGDVGMTATEARVLFEAGLLIE
tara:strand:- start:8186 stop:8545 length:360 start_codon:yes stop_codon:yes gene_type:complete